jgi:uncharacterized protein YecE (DUF72 family)
LCSGLSPPQFGVEEHTDQFLRVALGLKGRLGPVLFQLPSNFRKDLPRQESFLEHLGRRVLVGFEFRHESWNDDETVDCACAHSCALCVADDDEASATNLVKTAGWGHVRLRRQGYTDDKLVGWARRLDWREAHVFFKLIFYSCASVFDVTPLLMGRESHLSQFHSATSLRNFPL